jgi:8-oxo-dGTP diphosphatase
VAAGLVFQNGRLLIAQRRKGDHLGELWEFPGGKIEPGETAPEALRRELREELEIEVVVGDLLADVSHDYPQRRVRVSFYRCRPHAGVPRARGCEAFVWVTPQGLEDFEFPPADQEVLAMLRGSPHLWL